MVCIVSIQFWPPSVPDIGDNKLKCRLMKSSNRICRLSQNSHVKGDGLVPLLSRPLFPLNGNS